MAKEVYIVNRYDNVSYSGTSIPVKAFTNRDAAQKYVDELNQIASEVEKSFFECEDTGTEALRELIDRYIEEKYPDIWEKLNQEDVDLQDEAFDKLDEIEDEFIFNDELVLEYASKEKLENDDLDCLKIVLKYNNASRFYGSIPRYDVGHFGIELIEDN